MPETRRDFALYPSARTEIAVLRGRIDGYFNEEHRVGLRKTEYPVESGSTLTDNAVAIPERLRLEGMVSDILAAPGNNLTPDRATDAWAAIVALAKSRETFDVVTPIRVYRNMLVVRAEAPRNVRTGMALRFTIDLEELLFGDTEIARVTPAQAGGPAVARTSGVDGGNKASPAITPPPSIAFRDPDTLSSLTSVAGFPSSDAGGSSASKVTFTPRSDIPEASRVQQVQLTPDAAQTFRTNLGGQPVRTSTWWQPLDSNWYMTLSDVNRNPIVTGARLTESGLPLNGRVVDFAGQLFVDGQGEPGRDAWGSTHRLLYVAGDLI